MAGRRNAFLLLLMAATISVSLALYNGRVAPIGHYPWIGSLQPKLTDQHKCSVTILSNRWTMTSAHCVPMNPQYYKIVLGHGAPAIYHIAHIHRHEQFAKNGTHYENDIALLNTKRDIVLNEHVQVAVLPDLPVPEGLSCSAVGKGVRYDESAEYVTVGMTEVTDGPHVDPVQLDLNDQSIIPDPLMTIPVNGNLTHWHVYVKTPVATRSDYFRLRVYRKGSTDRHYSLPYGFRYRPTSVGPQRVYLISPWAVMEGDTIGLLYYYSKGYQARIPFKERVSCEKASLNLTKYGSGNFYTAFNDHPCREYAIRAFVKPSSYLFVMAPQLEEIKVTVTTTSIDKISVAGKEARPCKGDDGGTLSCNIGEVPVVYGMYSYSPGTCNASHTNAVYIQLSAYKGWIDDTIRDCPEQERGNVTDIQVLQTK